MEPLKATAKLVENVRIIIDNSRSHTVVCDLPVAKGGFDTGPTALELSVMSIAACAATIFADVCKQSNIELSELEVAAEAEKTKDPATLRHVTLKVSASANVRRQLLEAAWRRTEANCPVLNIFKETTPVNTVFEAATG